MTILIIIISSDSYTIVISNIIMHVGKRKKRQTSQISGLTIKKKQAQIIMTITE